MAQRPVTSYFNSCKRPATDDLRNKAKILILDNTYSKSNTRIDNNLINSEVSSPLPNETKSMKSNPKIVSGKESTAKSIKLNPVVHNVPSDSSRTNTSKTTKPITRTRASRVRKLFLQDGQADIRESFLKMADDVETTKKVLFEKKSALSPKKKHPVTPEKIGDASNKGCEDELPAVGSITPKKSMIGNRGTGKDLSLNEISKKINKSSRLEELKASIARFKNLEKKAEELEKQNEAGKPQIQKFDTIQLEITSPQKSNKSINKLLMSPPRKFVSLPDQASPQTRLLHEPKETISPVKSSPTKAPAYQRYLSLAESSSQAFPLPYHYRFLAEAFRCMDTISSMMFNRKETITFKKLKPAVQELSRHNFTLEHLAQIKTIYPNAFGYNQEKCRTFGSISKQEKYELVLTPIIEESKSKVNQSEHDTNMNPSILLERKRKFYHTLLERVKDEHEKFLISLGIPVIPPKDKLMRWHPEFDVEKCSVIEPSDLPQAPDVQKATSAKDVLDKAKSLFNCGTRMEKALQRLADAEMTSQSVLSVKSMNEANSTNESSIEKIVTSVVDTPPATPTVQSLHTSTLLRGIPKALLEKVRARQAAKALEEMTRTPLEEKEATLYSRLPELAKIVRNIFVAEKKGTLAMEFIIAKLDNSLMAKLTANEMEEHIRLLCKLLPLWASIHKVRDTNYVKLAKDFDFSKVLRRLEVLANEKVKGL